MKQMIKAAAVLAMAVLILALLPAGALASEQTCSITASFSVPGAAFRLYLVGESEDGSITLTGNFADYPVDPNSADAALTLAGYAIRNQLTPEAEAVTDENGTVRFSGLREGVYLLVGQRAITETFTYTPQPVLLQLPSEIDGVPVWDLRVQVKYDQTENQETTSVSVLKIWEGSVSTRPESITVLLLRDGEPYDSVTLSADNNWCHTWHDLDGECGWTVVEHNVPAGYQVSVTGDGTGFVLTNTYQGPAEPIEPQLPQTGQLWWPVGLLAVAGLALLVIGLIRRRGEEDYED